MSLIPRRTFPLVLLCAAPLFAEYNPGFPKEEFAARRAAFMAKISDGLAVFLGAPTRSDTSVFRQNNDFYYFSGVETPDAVLILDGVTKKSHLFVPLFTSRERRSSGPQLETGRDAESATGIDFVHPLSEFAPFLMVQLSSLPAFHIGWSSKTAYVSDWPEGDPSSDFAFAAQLKALQPWDNRPSREAAFIRWLRDQAPLAAIKSFNPIVDDMRRVKSPLEAAMIRKAAAITANGVNEAIRATRPGVAEYQIAAAADFVYAISGAQRLGYADIAASGPDGNIWHYFANRRKMDSDDVVLLDSGAELNYYGADLTRTWPVSGEFTPDQRKMYACVLDASLSVVAAVRPGATVAQLDALARGVFAKHGYEKYYPGGIGHYVGLAVHDVGDPAAPFVPGVVFNVEPILDMPEKHVQIRLEDTILVTPDGHENLTAGSPVQIDDLARLQAMPSTLFPRIHIGTSSATK